MSFITGTFTLHQLPIVTGAQLNYSPVHSVKYLVCLSLRRMEFWVSNKEYAHFVLNATLHVFAYCISCSSSGSFYSTGEIVRDER